MTGTVRVAKRSLTGTGILARLRQLMRNVGASWKLHRKTSRSGFGSPLADVDGGPYGSWHNGVRYSRSRWCLLEGSVGGPGSGRLSGPESG